ncbi:MAG: hypothetical protein LBU05_02165 [Bifidobacteriaceae bacterium]|nr:hypothetical protein [Bifidobacteriaceae bacterium]
MPSGLVKALGLFSPMIREQAELQCERDCPFTIDASETTAKLGTVATPWPALAAAVARERRD